MENKLFLREKMMVLEKRRIFEMLLAMLDKDSTQDNFFNEAADETPKTAINGVAAQMIDGKFIGYSDELPLFGMRLTRAGRRRQPPITTTRQPSTRSFNKSLTACRTKKPLLRRRLRTRRLMMS